MARRKRTKAQREAALDARWTRTTEWEANGRHVRPGTELSIRGERGRFRFRCHVLTDKGVEWIDVIGGPKGCQAWRSFRPDRVRTVHVKKTTITTREAKALQKEKRAARKDVVA